MVVEKESFVPVLFATRVIKRDGILLMRSLVRDGDFLLRRKTLFLERFGTLFHIRSIVAVSRGFHILFQQVTTPKEAEYLVGERFIVPRHEMPKDTVDMLIDMEVWFEGRPIGVVSAWQETPVYTILVVTGPDEEWRIPNIASVLHREGNKLIITDGAVLAAH